VIEKDKASFFFFLSFRGFYRIYEIIKTKTLNETYNIINVFPDPWFLSLYPSIKDTYKYKKINGL
jgi:hypothetical protein